MSVERIKSRLRNVLRNRGVRGIVGLKSMFMEMDLDGNGSLDFEEFGMAMKTCGMGLSHQDLRLLFLDFDADNSNSIEWDEFIGALRGDLTPGRRALVVRLFEGLDSDGDGVVTITDIGRCFIPGAHPDVQARKKDVATLLGEVLDTWEQVSNNGTLTIQDFVEYFRSASVFIESDEEFEAMIREQWNPTAGGGGGRRGAAEGANSLRAYAAGAAHAGGGGAGAGGAASGARSLASIASGGAENELQAILTRLKDQLARRGARGIVGLQRKFRIMDDDGSKTISRSEFKKAMRETGLDCNDEELNALFQHFDKDRSGAIDFDELLVGVRGVLNDRRRNLVNMAFDRMDKDGSGVIEPEDIVDTYDASKHPDVIKGTKSPDEVFREFLDTFDVGGEKDGLVTRQEFQNYYSNVSASIDDDDYFELMIRNTWHISGGEGQAANSSNRRVLVTHADGRQTVEEIKDDLGVKADDKEEMMRRLRGQGVSAANIALYGGGQDGVDEGPGTAAPTGRARGGGGTTTAAAVAAAATPGGGAPAKSLTDHIKARTTAQARNSASALEARVAATGPGARPGPPAPAAAAAPGGPAAASSAPVADPGVAFIIKKLKDELASRGARGIVGMSRKFRIMDDDGSKSLNMAEFKKAMTEMNMGLADSETRLLFQHFDQDGSGSIDFEEFVQGLRDPLNERRRALVHQAFAKIDKDGSGVVEPNEIVDAYDASKHPDVLEGKKTPDEIFREFMETFEVGEEVDGKITMREFENYYTNIGANIDNDDYFELMIRNAWHISGGEGWAANTANRRVLVTHADGRQTVEEIKEDLGVKADDKGEMVRRLRAQGVNAADISLFDGGDDGVAESGAGESKATPASLADAARSARQSGSGGGGGGAVALGAAAAAARTGGASGAAEAKSNDPQERMRQVALAGGQRNPKPVTRGAGSPTRAAGPRAGSAGGPVGPRAPDAGLLSIIRRLKQELKSRGANGFVGLQRKFRIMDDDGSKSLDMAEFKKAMKEMNMNLSDTELRMLFQHFDQDGSSSIDFEEFIQGVRDPLNERRERLVILAFNKLDKDGNGTVEPSEIVDRFDASKHPEVIAGRMTPDDVFREFLDTFDVGGEKDGMVTRQEFLNYYTNIGANIDNDDYFELMIRNAWHISGGEGWAANTANRRVLVTHADGSQTVQEIKEDLGVKADDKEEMVRRLRAQGVNAANISLFDGVEDGAEGGVPAGLRVHRDRGLKRLGVAGQPSAPSGVLPGTGAPPRPQNRPSTTASGASGPREADAGMASIIRKLKDELASRGARGIVGMSRKFRIMDDDGSKSLDMGEFRKAMTEMNMGLSDTELRLLFQHFDQDGSGTIDFEEFVQGVRDPLTDRRRDLVLQAFRILDTDGNGTVEPSELVGRYDTSQHPEVIAGRMTPDECLREFLETFDVGGEVDGKVTQQEFLNYYTNIGASIDNEDYFELMIRNAWHISGGEGWAANTANRRVLVTHADGSQTVQEIRNDLGVEADDKEEMVRRLRAQGVDASNIALYGGGEDGVDEEGAAPTQAAPAKTGKPAALGTVARKKPRDPSRLGVTAGERGQTSGYTSRQDHGHMTDVFAGEASIKAAGTVGAGNAARSQEMNMGLRHIIKKLKEEMKSRGAHGFIGLQRKFRIMDDDGNKALDMAEFKKGMKEMNMGLNDAELRLLFEHFDQDESGSISFEEFIQGVRDPLNDRRLNLVRQAFNILDMDGSGTVEPSELVGRYDASQHPEVIAGKKTADQVLREFLDTFDVGGQVDGKVTAEEFENYYTNIGANIDNDDYFELMIRNAWHISGGEGWAANTANRRVLVTHADGSQTVQEIQNDLGVKADDKEEMMRRLRAQGVDASNIALYGGGEDGVDEGGEGHVPTTFEKVQSQASAGGARRGDMRGEAPVRNVNRRAFESSLAFGDDGGSSQVGNRQAKADRLARRKHFHDGADTEATTVMPGVSGAGSHGPGRGMQTLGQASTGASVHDIMAQLKEELASRGARGIVGLSRKFRIMDDDGSQSLDYQEFKKAMRECNLTLDDENCRRIFQHFDRDGNGTIDYDEFIVGVRGVLNDRRKNMVNMAFDRMDKDGSGVIEPADIVDAYDASKHPDVIKGTKSPDEVFREFLDTFDVGGEKDGMVTRQEFQNYYCNVSASIDDDDYFELMIRNTWHISGGEGQAANSSNRRVLVTHADGRQTVEEIKDDLGVKADDKEEMVRRLRGQGVNASNIALFGGGEDGVDEGPGAAAAPAAPTGRAANPTFKSSVTFG